MATEPTDTAIPKVIQVPEYFYAIDINYLTHMIGKERSLASVRLQVAHLLLYSGHVEPAYYP